MTDSLIDQILAEVPGLDAAKVKVDANSAEVANQIAAVEAEATKLEVQGTPWFYLGVGVNPRSTSGRGRSSRASSAPPSTTR